MSSILLVSNSFISNPGRFCIRLGSSITSNISLFSNSFIFRSNCSRCASIWSLVNNCVSMHSPIVLPLHARLSDSLSCSIWGGSLHRAKLWEDLQMRCRGFKPDPGNLAVRQLRPVKTGVFSRRQTCQGKSQEPCSSDGRIAGWRETQNLEVLEPIDKVSLGGFTSHRAVTTVNVNVASKSVDPRAEPASEGRRQHGVPKSDRCGNPTSAG